MDLRVGEFNDVYYVIEILSFIHISQKNNRIFLCEEKLKKNIGNHKSILQYSLMETSKPFKLQYTNKASGERCLERPRLMVSVDGSQKSLVVGEDIIVASGDKDITESELWTKARSNIRNIK
jgi:hypothetical protein